MSYQVFARKYRPKTFDDVLGQDHVVKTLRNAIEQKRLAHAYLFVGPRGTGKTTTARILAKALNCPGGPRADFDPDNDLCIEIAEGQSLDVLEIDGASNNSVDDIRQIRETVNFAPARGQFKIYYIDEVHMLTNQAFNALLKTLEEPPEHVKFIFATTEPHKILATILSRCQRFDLRPIPADIIAQHMLHIASKEGISLDEAAAWAIAKGADGGMRDAQSMLDQLVAFCGDTIHEANVLDIFGFTARETVASLIKALLARETPRALDVVQREAEAGRELSQLLNELIGCLRALLIAGLDATTSAEGIPAEIWKNLTDAAAGYAPDRMLAVIDVFAETEGRMRWATNKRLHLELGLIKAIQALGEIRISDLIRVLGSTADQFPARGGDLQSPDNPRTTPQKPKLPEPEPTTPKAEQIPAPVETPDPVPVSTPAPKRQASSPLNIDALIEAAPEVADEPPAPAKQPAPEPEPTPEPEPAKPEEDDFYQDPLIQKALTMFQATLK